MGITLLTDYANGIQSGEKQGKTNCILANLTWILKELIKITYMLKI